jgi:hypothetical protein
MANALSTPTSTPPRARDDCTPTTGSPQQRRPGAGGRQASIGIRRMQSSNSLRQIAQQPSIQRLNAPMPALDEDHALGPIPPEPTKPSSTKGELSGFAKFKSKIPFWGNDKGKQKADSVNDIDGLQPGDDASMNYTSDMVDVLDTIGKGYFYQVVVRSANNSRSRGCYSYLPDQRPKLAIHSQPSLP